MSKTQTWYSNTVNFILVGDEGDDRGRVRPGELIIELQPSDVAHVNGQNIFIEGGYHEIADLMEKRHDRSDTYRMDWISELGELIEHIMCNSDWEWVPTDEAGALSNDEHMYIDDHGDLRILTGWWEYNESVYYDPIVKLFYDGYIVYQFEPAHIGMNDDVPPEVLEAFNDKTMEGWERFERLWKQFDGVENQNA